MPIAHALPYWLSLPAPDRPDQSPPGPAPHATPPEPAPTPARPPAPAFGSAEVHGLRNPLAGVRATVQLAQLQSGEGSAIAGLLGEALAEVDRLDERIRALLTLHAPREGKPRRFDLGDLLEDVATGLETRCEAAGVTLSWQIDAGLGELAADPELLEEALLELAQNALRASSAGGRLSFHARSEGSSVEILVRDTGSGIPAGIRSRIFDPFFTTRCDGTGLGLPSIRRRLEEAGGALDLEDTSETGSCFRLLAPRYTPG